MNILPSKEHSQNELNTGAPMNRLKSNFRIWVLTVFHRLPNSTTEFRLHNRKTKTLCSNRGMNTDAVQIKADNLEQIDEKNSEPVIAIRL